MGRGIGSYIKKADREYLMSTNCCFYCGSTENLHIEHIIPLNKGGTSDLPNLTRACQRCNSLKGTFLIEEFLERIFNKRAACHDNVMSYINRLERNRKRNRFYNHELSLWLENKISINRGLHTYYTKIIYSITNNQYFIYG